MIVKIVHMLDEDYVIVESATMEELMEISITECNKRGWLIEDCYNETIEG